MLPISIIIPCFPRDTPKLTKCLDSIKRQTKLPLEVVIGHSEISQEDSNSLKERYNYPFRIIISPSTKQCYAAENRNRASELAKGEYLSFIDADDQMHPQRLGIIWQVIQKYQPQCVVHGFSGNIALFNKKMPSPIPKHLTFGNQLYMLAKQTKHKHIHLNGQIHHGHSTIRSNLIKTIRLNENWEYRRKEDSKFIRDILNHYPKNKNTMIFIKLPLSYYVPA